MKKISTILFSVFFIAITVTVICVYIRLAWRPARISVLVQGEVNGEFGDCLVVTENPRQLVHPSLLGSQSLEKMTLTDESYLNGECWLFTLEDNKVQLAETYEPRITYIGPQPYYRKLPPSEAAREQPVRLSKGFIAISPACLSDLLILVLLFEKDENLYVYESSPSGRPASFVIRGMESLQLTLDRNDEAVVPLEKYKYSNQIRKFFDRWGRKGVRNE